MDAACARHDACTPDLGLPTKACNLRLERDAEAIARDPSQPSDVRSLAGLVAAFAAANPSEMAQDLVSEEVTAVAVRIVSTARR